MQVHDFLEEALPANSGVNDAALQEMVDRFVAEGIAAQTASEGLASQTSMSLDAFFAACHTSQVLLQAHLLFKHCAMPTPLMKLVSLYGALGIRFHYLLLSSSCKKINTAFFIQLFR